MLHKRLVVQIIIRVLLILANALLVSYLFFLGKYTASQINLLILLFLQGGLLVYYLNKTNRDLSQFFSSVTNEDSTIVFNEEKNAKSFTKLHEKLNKVNRIIEKARIEKIGQYEYLKQVVEHVGVGILSFDENFKIQFFNPAGMDILKINKLETIDDLDAVYPGLAQKLKKLQANNQQLITTKSSIIELDLSVKQVQFKINNELIKLFSFQNIQSELDKREVESWQKIIRVLTHEIMNSVSPIDSATNSISRLYSTDSESIKPKEITEEIISKTIKGLNIVQQRSKGMLSFVQKFRDLTLLPEPKKEKIEIQGLFQTIETLYAKIFKEKSIDFKMNCSPNQLTIFVDRSQIEQVLINLVKNSIESITGIQGAKIQISAFKNENNKIVISVSDNGIGITEEIQKNIFTPFFTTKESGSGIGLSLSRQIMHVHGGKVSVLSESHKTIFVLEF